ncbi:MAG: NAD-dependent protein deacylase [Myxococcales bacterium]|nr:NAD-dependent protein deacylase [Myxococcales bacterium]
MAGLPPRRDTVDRKVVDQVAGLLANASSALFITGAGMSADSGLPTYRGIGGLYERKLTDDALPIEAVLSGPMLASRPELVWKYIHDVELACRHATPNRGHEILALIGERIARTVVFTQNVDGFHRAAGSKRVIAIHGDLHDLRCTACAWHKTVPDYSTLSFPPSCPKCGSVVRPDVVLFGEPLPEGPFQAFEAEVARGFDIVFLIGTSALFPYVARPVLLAKSEGVPTVEINPSATDLSDVVDFRFATTAKHALRALWIAFKSKNVMTTRLGR